ncbi:MAG: acyl-CoA synthetase FdrA [Chloroflexi bacterium]|nr:acyl-CoA synthetase FdrA [Anaerolineaceae bacterium]NMB89894.1 acyl-CoA synthetase FdrA [Chloroflexota bacterium]
MATSAIIKRNTYQDSVTLMQVSSKLASLPGIEEAAAMMATPANIAVMADAGLLTETARRAQPSDLVIALKGESPEALQSAFLQVDELLAERKPAGQGEQWDAPHTMMEAFDRDTDANLVLISTPGAYAATEAYRALQENRHVFMFSDNVAIEAEIALKRLATEKGLLMMGPDCGTAIINGHPLGFANVIRRGPIGVVGASGTGLQEVTALIDRLGSGVSQAIGLGTHDLSEAVGGMMMMMGIDALEADPATRVITLISKPPAASIARKILQRVEKLTKPVVVNFLGGDLREIHAYKAIPASTLEDAAVLSVAAAAGSEGEPVFFSQPTHVVNQIIQRETARLRPEQKFVRGLFSGGTFCYEAQLLLRDVVGKVYSNTPLSPDRMVKHHQKSHEHTLLDLGSDEYTVGRPHPMIDFRTRVNMIAQEAEDAETAVILLDVVLGYGSHADPAAELGPAVRAARASLDKAGRSVAFIGSVCGTDADFQQRTKQCRQLAEAGIVLMDSNAQAARLAGLIANRSQVA